MGGMFDPWSALPSPLQVMADGTIKQLNPFNGTEVWTVPGRGNRPLSPPHTNPTPVDPLHLTDVCAFCTERYHETPPEKARVVRDAYAPTGFRTTTASGPNEVMAQPAEFRRIPNLFEIVSYPYWQENYSFAMSPAQRARMEAYLSAEGGTEHVLAIVEAKMRAAGNSDADIAATSTDEKLAMGEAFFAGGHDVIIGRRHHIDDARYTHQLCGSGQLSIDEHAAYTAFTVESMQALYEDNPYARYVAVFQNWLRPAGASFDHLHKQLVAIDERGAQATAEIARLRHNPNLYNDYGVNFAAQHNLVVATTEHAVCVVGVGHRYPSLEIYSTSSTCEPWLQTPEEIRSMSNLVHAIHAATGSAVPANEEWRHRGADVDLRMPWRISVKWRISTPAGFEGGTKIFITTLSPEAIRDRVVTQLYRLREAGIVSDELSIATETTVRPNSLGYYRG